MKKKIIKQSPREIMLIFIKQKEKLIKETYF